MALLDFCDYLSYVGYLCDETQWFINFCWIFMCLRHNGYLCIYISVIWYFIFVYLLQIGFKKCPIRICGKKTETVLFKTETAKITAKPYRKETAICGFTFSKTAIRGTAFGFSLKTHRTVPRSPLPQTTLCYNYFSQGWPLVLQSLHQLSSQL